MKRFHETARLVWCGLIGCSGRGPRWKPKNLSFAISSTCCGANPRSESRLLLVGLYRLGVLDALKIIRPETLLRWHRAGFRAFWRWKSRPHALMAVMLVSKKSVMGAFTAGRSIIILGWIATAVMGVAAVRMFIPG